MRYNNYGYIKDYNLDEGISNKELLSRIVNSYFGDLIFLEEGDSNYNNCIIFHDSNLNKYWMSKDNKSLIIKPYSDVGRSLISNENRINYKDNRDGNILSISFLSSYSYLADDLSYNIEIKYYDNVKSLDKKNLLPDMSSIIRIEIYKGSSVSVHNEITTDFYGSKYYDIYNIKLSINRFDISYILGVIENEIEKYRNYIKKNTINRVL